MKKIVLIIGIVLALLSITLSLNIDNTVSAEETNIEARQLEFTNLNASFDMIYYDGKVSQGLYASFTLEDTNYTLEQIKSIKISHLMIGQRFITINEDYIPTENFDYDLFEYNEVENGIKVSIYLGVLGNGPIISPHINGDRFAVMPSYPNFSLKTYEEDYTKIYNSNHFNSVFISDNGVPRVIDLVNDKVIDIVNYDITPFCHKENSGVSEKGDKICVRSIELKTDEKILDGLKFATIYFDIELFNINPRTGQPFPLAGAKIKGYDEVIGEKDIKVMNGDKLNITLSQDTQRDIKVSSALKGVSIATPIAIGVAVLAPVSFGSSLLVGGAIITIGGIVGWYQGQEKIDNIIQAKEYEIEAFSMNANYTNLKVYASNFATMGRDVSYEYMLEDIFYIDEYGQERTLKDIDYSDSGVVEGVDNSFVKVIEAISDLIEKVGLENIIDTVSSIGNFLNSDGLTDILNIGVIIVVIIIAIFILGVVISVISGVLDVLKKK